MLTRATVEGLRELRLDCMAEANAEQESSGGGDGPSRDEWLGLLVDRDGRAGRRCGTAAFWR